MAGKVALVLGGGVGGLTAANELRRLLGREHRVILIERRRDHLFAASLLWLMVGGRRREQPRGYGHCAQVQNRARPSKCETEGVRWLLRKCA